MPTPVNGAKKYFVQIFMYFVIQQFTFVDSLTIDFNSIGFIGESIVLQCQDILPISVSSADWYRGGSFMNISSSRYSETITPTGFNLTISSLAITDGGLYYCGIGFDISTTKSLTILYNTKDVNITQLDPKGIEITFIAFPDPDYVATVKQDGVQLEVNWNVFKSTQASGAIKVSLQNSTAFTNPNKNYTVHVKITSPLSLDVEKNITLVFNLTTQSVDDCAPEAILGHALGAGLGSGVICIICFIFIVIRVKSGATDPKKIFVGKLVLGLGFGIICVSCIACLIILVTIGKSCSLKLGLGLGLGLGIPCVGCIIVMFKKEVKIQNKDEFRQGMEPVPVMQIKAFVHGFFIQKVQWYGPHGNILTSNRKYNIKYYSENGISTLQILPLEVDDRGYYTCRAIGIFGSSAKDGVFITVYANIPANELKVKIQNKHELEQDMRESLGMQIKAFVHGFYLQRVHWHGPDGTILTSIGKYNIQYDNGTEISSLQISPLAREDSGSYICCAIGLFGQAVHDSVSITVNATAPAQKLATARAQKLATARAQKLEVKIQNKHEFKQDMRESHVMQIIAFVHGFSIQGVQWYGPDGNILTSNGKYNIQYDKGTRISSLQISPLAENDSGSYICYAIGLFGQSVHDSVSITVNATAPAQKLATAPAQKLATARAQKLVSQDTSQGEQAGIEMVSLLPLGSGQDESIGQEVDAQPFLSDDPEVNGQSVPAGHKEAQHFYQAKTDK